MTATVLVEEVLELLELLLVCVEEPFLLFLKDGLRNVYTTGLVITVDSSTSCTAHNAGEYVRIVLFVAATKE